MNRIKDLLQQGVDKLQGGPAKRIHQYYDDAFDKMMKLSFQQAEELALQALANRKRFDCMDNEIHANTPVLQQLSAGLQKLFGMYSYISTVEPIANIGICEMKPIV